MNEATEPASSVQASEKPSNKLPYVIAAVAVILAIIGFVLFFVNQVPSNAAAKVNDTYITEDKVAERITQYRSAYGYSDDSDFASMLSTNGYTVASYRMSIIDQLALSTLVEARAKELGITVSDEEVQAELESISGSVSSGDNSIWASTLESMGLTEDILKERYRANILQDKLCEKEVSERTASDDEVLAYAQSYLAGTTQMHVYRIVCSGDDMATKASDAYAAVKALQDGGTLTWETFSEVAKKYSDESAVDTTGGELGWTGSGAIGTDLAETLESMGAGQVAGPISVESDNGALEIVYVDQDFTFPSAESMTSLASLNLPSKLRSVVQNAADYTAWQSDCNAYLAKMLANAQMTYYPTPANAAYNVSLS